MVRTATNLGRNGVKDWLVQRFTAVVLSLYTVFIVGFIVFSNGLTFELWASLFDQLWMKIFTVIATIALAAHSWIGLWGVLTDYVTKRMLGDSALSLRLIVLSIYALITLSYVIWVIAILWG